MTGALRTLVVGVGSAHGDDQAGWLMANSVASCFKDDPTITVRLAKSPMDILDWLEGFSRIYVCDACFPTNPSHAVHQFLWNAGKLLTANQINVRFEDPTVAPMRSQSSHGLGLFDVFRLAELTMKLPLHVTIWAVEGRQFAPGDSISETTQGGVSIAANAICREIRISRQPPTATGEGPSLDLTAV
jgi:hydrogenase maturation protease